MEAAAAEAAIGAFAGAEAARGYRSFRERAGRIHAALDAPFLSVQRPGALAFATQAGLRGLLGTSPFTPLWTALGEHFRDVRLRQGFGRVAGYVGASPLQAPATLMLVAHVEMQGAWRVEGGLPRLAEALGTLAAARGAVFRYGAEVREIAVTGGRASGVRLANGEMIAASSVLCNAEPAAIGAGLFGRAAARAVDPLAPERRSFSAITWALPRRVEGVAAQTVLHAEDPTAEYVDIAYRARLPMQPSITLWAEEDTTLVMTHAPARADLRPIADEAISAFGEAVFARLAATGIVLDRAAARVTTPRDFAIWFPGSGGALYGAAPHGWQAAFNRPAARTRLPGLVLAGGGTHPGAGVAMAAISGRLAAERIIEDRG
ncbi:FAD-dependent oxidoreductase [Leptolyngbya sp. 15MV]|nr:FAD-dependent oxidoreductase [Leptolyngbya sp. 15MV]